MPHAFTLRLSDDLHAAAELLRKRRHYRSLTEYVVGLIRYDGQTQREHYLTSEWAALSGHERDRLDNAIFRQVEKGIGVRGSYLEARIESIVKACLEGGEIPTPREVATKLARDLAENPPPDPAPKQSKPQPEP